MTPPLVTSIVGGDSLLGRELRDVLSETHFPGKVQLAGADEQSNVLSIQQEEPLVISALEAEMLAASKLIFLAGTPESSRRTLQLLRDAKADPLLIDLSYGLDDLPDARLRAPLLEPEPAGAADRAGRTYVIAHPAATALAMVFARLEKHYRPRQAVVQIFEPASERGRAGLHELQQQTASLLSFKSLSKDVFDAQLSFNMLARYGSGAPEQLHDVEQRIERHLVTLLGGYGSVRVPSLRLIQAPVFHGYSFSLWLEFEENPGVKALAESLATAQIEVRDDELEPPSNVGCVGQSGVTIGLLEVDRNHPKAVWAWGVADNFRVSADNAVQLARALVGEAR